MDFENRAVLITGGSRGLGAALGRAFARAGARVVLVARERAALDEVVTSIRASGGQAYGLAHDVADKEAIHRLAGAAAALVGPIDVLVQNASALGPMRLLLDTDCEDFSRVLEVNLVGPFRLAKVIAGSMLVRGSGLVVSISSDAAVEAYPRWGAYGVSKAALDHLSRTFAAELAGTGVRFLAIDPGEMDTKMHADALGPPTPELARPEDVAERLVRVLDAPNGRRLSLAGGAP